MATKRFQAPTIQEAYDSVRETLGDDAVILSTRQAVAPGLLGFGKREFIEVIADLPPAAARDGLPLLSAEAADDLVRQAAEATASRGGLDVSLPQEPPAPARPARRRTAKAAPAPVDEAAADLAPPFVNALAGSGRGGPFDVQARRSTAPPEPATPSVMPVMASMPERSEPSERYEMPAVPAMSDEASTLASLAAGMQEVRALVERIALDRTAEELERGPAALKALRDRLAAQGMPAAVLLPLFNRVGASMAADASVEAVQQAVQRRLAAMLPKPVSIDFTRRPATLFLVGPSGAGKTTLAVRLGLQLQESGLRVTIAGTDVDRVGAPQQLQAFGAAAGLRTRTCYTPGELQALVAEGESDLVIVDTAGHNGSRPERMAELQAFLQASRDRSVLLTIPATMQAEDLQQLTRAYAPTQPRALALTRCDEAAAYGGVVGTVAASAIGVAYTAHDESVGQPARPGDQHALAAAVVQGRWPERATAASRGRRAG